MARDLATLEGLILTDLSIFVDNNANLATVLVLHCMKDNYLTVFIHLLEIISNPLKSLWHRFILRKTVVSSNPSWQEARREYFLRVCHRMPSKLLHCYLHHISIHNCSQVLWFRIFVRICVTFLSHFHSSESAVVVLLDTLWYSPSAILSELMTY